MSPFELIPGYTVREGTPEEFSAYFRDNVKVMFPHSVQFNVNATLSADMAQSIRERGRSYPGRIIRWFIECEGAIVGSHVGEEVDPATFYMRNTAIHPDHRRRGLYRAFLASIIEHLRPMNYVRLTSRHAASNNAVIIPKLQAGFMITGLEISDRHGTLVNLTYFYHQPSIEAMKFRTGEQRPGDDIRPFIDL